MEQRDHRTFTEGNPHRPGRRDRGGDQQLPWVTAIGDSLLGMASMALYLWKRHPRLRGSFDEAPLGAEVKPPPHPTGVPRGSVRRLAPCASDSRAPM
jgi:hypothetical protein